ncbi:N-acetylglucosamine-6-phosphate deacetylase [Citricoccus sp. GCM10030269]|uniref:N-acetylglucosamine-6-phosphate deacetylase n=1 Tax=Citricoccus sp. GCM10030269 TaxID=3273388 RepID=UPI0036225875
MTPGLVDQHCHGALGVDFATAPTSEIRGALQQLSARGVTRVVASVPTMPPDAMLAAVRRLATLVQEDSLAGIHVEGPFLAESRCGAQSPTDLRRPDAPGAVQWVSALLETGGRALTAMTYAPELPGAERLEEMLLAAGVLPSPGHTEASSAELAAAVERIHPGRLAVTHLFNAMPPFHHRTPGPTMRALALAAQGRLRLELIADGHHVDSTVIQDVFTLAPDAVCVVSDASAATEAAPGHYALGAVTVTAGTATPASTDHAVLASGAVLLDGAFQHLLRWGIPVEDAVPTVTSTPAEGLPHSRRDSGWVVWNGDGRAAVVVPPGSQPVPQ